MKLIYCDLIAYDGLHSGFNSAMIKVLDSAFDPDRIEFYAECTHIDICKKKISGIENIGYHKENILSKKFVGGLKTILKDLFGAYLLLKLFIKSENEDVICIGLAYPFSQLATYLFTKLFRREFVYLCQHGELEIVLDLRNTSLFKKAYFGIEKLLFRLNSSVNNVILGQTIYDNIKPHFPKMKCVVIDHPYDFNLENSNEYANELSFPLVIGFIGNTSLNKGTQYVFQLAELLKEFIIDGKLKLKIIGKFENMFKSYDNGMVEYHYNSLIPEAQFQEEIKSIHYSVLFRDDRLNRLTASGTFFDTVKYMKPYLSFRGEYINYYHQLSPKSGELFDSVESMSIAVKLIIENFQASKLKYSESVFEMYNLQRCLSIANNSLKLKNQSI